MESAGRAPAESISGAQEYHYHLQCNLSLPKERRCRCVRICTSWWRRRWAGGVSGAGWGGHTPKKV